MSKWIVINVIDNDIFTKEFLTYENAFAYMSDEYDYVVQDDDNACFTSDCASIRSEYGNYDWKIIRVDF